MDDYAKAARVFKPVSGMLAGRFSSSSTSSTTMLEEAPKIAPGLYQPPKKPVGSATSQAGGGIAKLEELLTENQRAAREGRFGRLTRSVVEFRPSKLVCKRFGVKVPYSDDNSAGKDEEEEDVRAGGGFREAGKYRDMGGMGGKISEPLGKASMEELMKVASGSSISASSLLPDLAVSTSIPAPPKPNSTAISNSTRATLESVGLGDDEAQGKDTLVYVKAPDDIFKAIFAESDDSDDDEEEEEETAPVVATPVSAQSLPNITVALHPPSTVPLHIVEPISEPVETSLSAETVSSYKPSFVSRTAIDSTTPKPTKDGLKKEKKEKKSKKNKKSTLSFDVEDGEDSTPAFSVTKKRKTISVKEEEGESKSKKSKEDEDAWDDWVEVEQLPGVINPVAAVVINEEGGKNKRQRAADLY